MRITFIGDVQGKMAQYTQIIAQCERSIQVGDFGIGFVPVPDFDHTKHHFIRGNHDDPSLAEQHPAYIAEGYSKDYPSMFFVPGAHSIDWQYRLPGRDWWPEEQLSIPQCESLLEGYCGAKIMVSHDCPHEAWFAMTRLPARLQRTPALLDRLLEKHRPDLWIFGHHHKSWRSVVKGTQYVCLAELETFQVEV